MSVKMGVYCVHMCVVRHEEVCVCLVCVCVDRVLRGKSVACTYMGGIVGCTYM